MASSGGPPKKRRTESCGGGDRLSKLEDRALGHILSFLPATEAARATLLSPRWRGAYAAVHTFTPAPESAAPSAFSCAVSLALLARSRRGRGGAAPLRGLRVALGGYCRGDSAAVDQWVSYAVQQADPEGLDLGIRLSCRLPPCDRRYSLRRRAGPRDEGPGPTAAHHQQIPVAMSGFSYVSVPHANNLPQPQPVPYDVVDVGLGMPLTSPRRPTAAVDMGTGSGSDSDDDDCSVLSSDYDADKRAAHQHYYQQPPEQGTAWPPEHVITSVLFSCAALRSLSLSSCWVAPPAAVSLPSLEALHLSHVYDGGGDVERLVAGCPRLADLTLEGCEAVTALAVLGRARLRRLALRCCHNLAAVAVDSSELRAFEYRGAVPDRALLTLHGGAGRVAYCGIDICGEEPSSEEELFNLRQLLQRFEDAEHLHLESARLGSGMDRDVLTRFPTLSRLRHLELRGRVTDDDAGDVVGAVTRILEHAPSLEALSLFFHPEQDGSSAWQQQQQQQHAYYKQGEGELFDEHHLSYNPHSVLATPSAMAIPSLRSRVREINLVHYQGGRGQRTLAKFLLCNAPAIQRLWCEFAEGPLWTQTQLMREIRGWLMNKSASTHFA